MKISLTTRSCTLRDKVYETYPVGVAFDNSPGAITQSRCLLLPSTTPLLPTEALA